MFRLSYEGSYLKTDVSISQCLLLFQYICIYIYVCVWDREREKERQRHRERQREIKQVPKEHDLHTETI